MIVALGADHAGYLLKETIKKYFTEKKIDFKDYGTFKMDSCDYPEFGYKVSQAVITQEANVGILICGTGIGMCITANKIKGIRAALANDVESAQLSRLHNDANVLCLSGRKLPEDEAIKIIDTWLNTSFEGGRHEGRLNLISQLTGL
ncbi:MAG: ribose 5-phosphate isomerase B [Calditrichaceae bacterium]